MRPNIFVFVGLLYEKCINFVGWVEVMRPNIFVFVGLLYEKTTPTLSLYPTYVNKERQGGQGRGILQII
jgi:hypothetical protein